MKRKRSTKVLTVTGILLVLFLAFLLFIGLYPYAYQFPTYPRLTHTHSGADGDPINLIFVGSKEHMRQSFQQAGWLLPDPITQRTSKEIAAASLAHRSYPTAPISNLYVYGRVQDMAFEKPTHDVQKRGHIRLWNTGTTQGGQPVWLGQASYDRGIELSSTNLLPTHHIAPTVDLERNLIGTDLKKTGLVKEEDDVAFTHPIFYARNGGGDYYESDGEVLVITYSGVPLSFTQQQVWFPYALKNDLFLFYDTLLVALNIIGINL